MLDWSKIHNQEGISPLSPPLAFLSFFYGAAVRLGLRFPLHKKYLPGCVISIGNLTAGGTGKTPAVCMLAEWVRARGYSVAVLSRGYRGDYKGRAMVVSDGKDIQAGPAEAGDEPCLLARKLKGIPVVVSKRRYTAGVEALERFGSRVFILDDGFQHRRLGRDLDIVLIDASNPFGNGRLLPRGPLREPAEQLKRADCLVLTRAREIDGADALDFIHERFPDKPVFLSDHVPEQLVFPGKDETHGVECLKGKRVAAFAGIARPDAFMATLKDLGAEIAVFRGFRDHHVFSRDELGELMDAGRRQHAGSLITTEKDWVRIKDMAADYPDIGYLSIRWELKRSADRFFEMVRRKIEECLE